MADIKPLASMKADDAAALTANIEAVEKILATPSNPLGTLPLAAVEKVGELADCMRNNPNNLVSQGKLSENASITMAIAACKASPKP